MIRRNENKRGGRLITFLLALVMLLAVTVTVTVMARGVAEKEITSFESETIYAMEVEGGKDLEELGLPETLRAVVDISGYDVNVSTFTQVTPTDADTYGYTSSHTVSSSSLTIYKTENGGGTGYTAL